MTLHEMGPITPEGLEPAQGESGRDFVLDTVRKSLDVRSDPDELSYMIATVTNNARPRGAVVNVPHHGRQLSQGAQPQFAGGGAPDPWFADEKLTQRALGMRAWSKAASYPYMSGATIFSGAKATLGQPFIFRTYTPARREGTFTPSLPSVLTDSRTAELQNLLDPGEDGETSVDEAVVLRAIEFLNICPYAGPTSEFSASGTEDRDVMLTWSVGYFPLLTVLITSDGKLIYSALLPRGHDAEQVQGELPWDPNDGVPPLVETCFGLFVDAAS